MEGPNDAEFYGAELERDQIMQTLLMTDPNPKINQNPLKDFKHMSDKIRSAY